MRLFHKIIFTFIISLVTLSVSSQDNNDETIVVDGKQYILHKVKMGETIFSLSKTYKIESKVLINNNPGLIQGLKVDEIIRIPYKGAILTKKAKVEKSEPSRFITHKIKRRETPYFIAKKYGITIDDIYSYNPGLKKLRKGNKIRIPQWDKKPEKIETLEEIKEDIKEMPIKVSSHDGMIIHRVKPGETLYSISKKYNRSINEIITHNPEAKNPRIGMEIRLPKEKEIRVEEKEMKRIGEFFLHTIETGETLYGLQKKYNVPREELVKANPVLESAFPAGVLLKIPVKYLPQSIVKPVNEEAFINHTVQKGETLYGLSSLYKVKIPQIKKYNPALELRDGLLADEVILIPKAPKEANVPIYAVDQKDSATIMKEYYKVETVVEIPEECQPMQRHFFFDTYHIGLLLPLFLEANDTINISPVDDELIDEELAKDEETEILDTIIETEYSEKQAKRFYKNSESFLSFYEGVLLAIDSMKGKGMNVELHVFDTERDRNSIVRIMATDEFRNLNLIIGPIYPSLQKMVADFSSKNRIPMVSPLSSNNNFTAYHPYFFQVNPSYNYLLSQTAELITDEYFDSNFIVFKTDSKEDTKEELLTNLCHEKLFNSGHYSTDNEVSFKIYNFHNQGSFGIPRILSKEKENVIIIPSGTEGEISVAVSNINNHASKNNITVIGTNKYQQYESISQEHFHNVKLKYISPYWIDYTSTTTNNFYSNFRDIFKAEPNQFAVQGFDVSFYFLNALWEYGKSFYSCLPYLDVELIQGNYNFEKVSPLGGYMNHGASVISYSKDYDITRERMIGQGNRKMTVDTRP